MQGGHDWFETLGKTYDDLGYTTSRADPCVRSIGEPGGDYTLTDTYTDDVWGASSSTKEAGKRKGELEEKWELKDVGENHFFLGMKIDQDLKTWYHLVLSTPVLGEPRRGFWSRVHHGSFDPITRWDLTRQLSMPINPG